MKLYVLLSNINNSIIAISEYKYHMKLFILQNNYNINKNYSIKVYTNKKSVNEYLIDYDDYYLVEYKNFVIRYKDKEILKDIIYSMKKKIKDTRLNLIDITSDCIMSPNDHETLNKAIDVLYSNKINSMINLEGLIRDYYNNQNYQDELSNLFSMYQNRIK